MNMNERERVRYAIKEWQEREIGEVKKRAINIDLFAKLDHIIDIIGVRRSGKTFLMFMVMRELEKAGVRKDSIIYINFENRVLYPPTERLLDALLDYTFEKGPKKTFLFLDEIHNIRNWERWARSVYDSHKGRIKIVVSGSTSRIIRKDIASLLTGRHVPIKVFPLSFSEFLDFRDVKLSKEDALYSARKQAMARSMLEEYLKYGGFPEVCLEGSGQLKTEILRAYYDDILYKDIMEKHGIKETVVMENFLRFLLSNVSSYFSYKRGKEYLNSQGIPVSTRTLLRYTSVLEEVFFFFVPIFSRKVREQLKYPRKIYAVDMGLRNAINPLAEGYGKMAENIVYLELRRRFKESGTEINYWKSSRQEEVDFLVREGPKVSELIQVCWDMVKEETKERETKALLKAMDEFGLKKGIVITKDLEMEEKIGSSKIGYIPLWKWLLAG
jgi:predicted AAA+ superfamily ATPase